MSPHNSSKALGTLPYVLDQAPPGSLYARLIHATGPHSAVTVDRSALLALPDVVAVLTADDDPGSAFSTNPVGVRDDLRVFTAEARFPGDIVGAVVARTRTAARAAAALPVHESPLPAVLTADAALLPDSPPAHRDFVGNIVAEFGFGAPSESVLEALGSSPIVLDNVFHTDPAPHNFLEPLAAIGIWDGAGICRVVSNTQCPRLSHALVARILSISEDAVDYRSAASGGSFGGKEEFFLDIVAALCSRAVRGQPVVVETSRAETTAMNRLSPGMSVRVATGFDDSGKITARLIEATLSCGPYAGHTPNIAGNGLALGMVLYPAPVTRATARCVTLNRVPSGPYRGYGGPQILFAVESQMDEIAHRLGIDAARLRALNTLHVGQADPLYGWPVSSFNLVDCLRRGKEASQARSTPGTAPIQHHMGSDRFSRGSGFAALANISGLTGVLGTDTAEARCEIADGRLRVSTACPDFGQGLHPALARIAAQVSDLPVAMVDVVTDSRLADLGAVASRGTYLTTNAVALAARALRAAADPAIPLLAQEGLTSAETFAAPDNALVAGAQFVEVEVDRATGAVRILKAVSVHDAGTIIDPTRACGQVIGGVVQGSGMALWERVVFDEQGRVTDPSLHAQAIPSPEWDFPIQALFLEDPHPHGIGGKSLGESPVIGIMPAIANAIYDAIGVRLRHAPFTPERVLQAIAASEPTSGREQAG